MFGLTFEKLLLVGLVAAVIIGPRRLPVVVAWIASLVRGLRRTVDAARSRATTELGVSTDAASWRALDPRQYDPRRIIAEALAAPPAEALAAPPAETLAAPSAAVEDAAASQEAPGSTGVPPVDVSLSADRSSVTTASRTPSGGTQAGVRRVRVGTSAHPRWIEVADEAPTTSPSPPGTIEAHSAVPSLERPTPMPTPWSASSSEPTIERATVPVEA